MTTSERTAVATSPKPAVRNPRSASVDEASAHLCLTPKRFRELVAAGVIGKADGKGYDLDTVRREYIDHLRKPMLGRASKPDGLDPVAERARKDKEMADRLALQNATTRDELAPVPVFQQAFADVFAIVRARIMAMPDRLARPLVGLTDATKAKAILQQGAEDTLTALSRERFPSRTPSTRPRRTRP